MLIQQLEALAHSKAIPVRGHTTPCKGVCPLAAHSGFLAVHTTEKRPDENHNRHQLDQADRGIVGESGRMAPLTRKTGHSAGNPRDSRGELRTDHRSAEASESALMSATELYQCWCHGCERKIEVPAGSPLEPEQISCPRCGTRLSLEWRPAGA